MTTTAMPEKKHHGRAVKRIREILYIKQDVLADALGISQQSVSLLEAKETIDPETLEKIAEVLKVPVDAIKNFNEEAAVNIIANTFQDESVAYAYNYKCTFNPLDQYIETVEKNERLYEELLKSERERLPYWKKC